MLSVASLLFALQVAGDVQFEHPTHEEMQDRLEACGFERATPVTNYVVPGEYVLLLDEDATDEELMCAARALDRTVYTPMFGPIEIAERFYRFSDELARPRVVALAKAYFAERPKLGEPPGRTPDETDFELAKRLESFCGNEATGAFTDKYGGVAISQEWLGQFLLDNQKRDAISNSLECLKNAAVLAELQFGFVGNEREAVGDPAEADTADQPITE